MSCPGIENLRAGSVWRFCGCRSGIRIEASAGNDARPAAEWVSSWGGALAALSPGRPPGPTDS